MTRQASFIRHHAIIRSQLDATCVQDGTLGADEVYSILCKADPRISAAEAKQIFDSCDRDGDGKINFDELRDYLHPVSANENTAYRKVMRDGFSVKSPGPLDYDAWPAM